jgi:molecular chaperone GrpE
VLLVGDRIEATSPSAAEGVIVDSIHQELVELLARQGVARVDFVGTEFTPSRHQAVGGVEVAREALDGVVVSEVRAGYLHGDRVLRTAEVEVGRPPRR